MKIGVITKPNDKGQIVIPKEMRDQLGINPDVNLNMVLAGEGIYLYPIRAVITQSEINSSYLSLLQKTKGTWAKEDWESILKTKSKTELAASRKRKKSW
ncbi:MAG: hypothetical protein UW86_C0014G0009 [Microgenomates group bacterium GW2011_GWA1_Microgenomates_45_10]|nr:MAG: hypothetical protein UW69_C0047G0004 [Microgenomates group bacterium GW2011_GWA2_44_7]KKT77928.1 MAG: hypothetical protein UW73_C0009G0027 [Microgenomates group bacterium GW2011_GWB1_44_8]KKT86935.1 MAG: hypothetical protein UW86_C0014G0009 [Microgenomates group bacterium GW2011_GWA1_Microgenomates_45_10]